MNKKSILLIAPFKSGHNNFDKLIIEALVSNFNLTLYSPVSHKIEFEDINVINSIIDTRGKSGPLMERVACFFNIMYARFFVKSEKYDHVIFLAYETISIYFSWIFGGIIYLIEHNNLEEISRSKIKRYFYTKRNNKIRSIVLSEALLIKVINEYKRYSSYVPHPVPNMGSSIAENLLDSKGRMVIFSPSGSTTKINSGKIFDALKNIDNILYICKGKKNVTTDKYIEKNFFNNYFEIMASSDYVLIIGEFDDRVSGVLYDAFSLRRPVIMLESIFAREMKEKYPSMILLIKSISDLPEILIKKFNVSDGDFLKFKQNHSRGEIGKKFNLILKDK